MTRNQRMGGTFSSPIFSNFIDFDDDKEDGMMPTQESSIENGDHNENPSLIQIDNSPIIIENSLRRYKDLAQIYNDSDQVEIDPKLFQLAKEELESYDEASIEDV